MGRHKVQQLALDELCVDVRIGARGQALEDHDGGHEEELLADVEHVLGRSGRHEVQHVLDGRQVAFAAVDLRLMLRFEGPML
jgi:hypothetical protein